MFSVYLYDRYVGTIERRRQGMRFTYAETAVADGTVPALSISLPKRPEPYPDREASPFFRNLLPEDAYRRLVTTAARTNPGDSIALLGAIGGECAGAVSIWPDDSAPPAVPQYRPLSNANLLALFGPSGRRDLGSAITRGRLSLPGVQEKIALLRQLDGTWALPLNGAVTSHILKQPTGDYPELLENELFCMALAKRVGLPVPECGIPARGLRIFCAERFDRPTADSPDGGPRRKVHQEDFCQVLRVPPERKYEREGGPGITRCARVIREYSALPAEDLPALLRWVGFNCLIGNEDAHAKNLAFLYTNGGLRLTPHYDLVSTEVYDELERVLAMKVGTSWDIRNIQKTDWRRVAERIGLPWERVRPMLVDLAARVAGLASEVAQRCADHYGPADMYARTTRVATDHARQMDRALRGSAR